MRLLHFSLHSLTWLHELAAFGRSDKEQVIKNKTPFTLLCHFDRSAEERSAQSRNLIPMPIETEISLPKFFGAGYFATPAVVATVEMTKKTRNQEQKPNHTLYMSIRVSPGDDSD